MRDRPRDRGAVRHGVGRAGPGWKGHRLDHTGMVIRLGVPADLAAVAGVYRSASLSNAGDRVNLLAHPEYLIIGPEGLAEGRTHVAEESGSVIGFATWALVGGTVELADLFVDPGWMRRGIATALVGRIADVLRSRGVACLEVTANPHARGFYRAAGFIGCGVAETAFGSAPRMLLAIRLPRPQSACGQRISDGLRSNASRSPAGMASTTSCGYSTRCPLTRSAIAGGRRAKHGSHRPVAPVGRNRAQSEHRSRAASGSRTGFRR
jgi:GNAT superfamily N-acetyltransferase